jgi:hypothetical protein
VAKLLAQTFQEVGNTGLELNRCVGGTGFPIGSDKQLFKIVIIVLIGKSHLGVEVMPEAVGDLFEILQSTRVRRCWTEVESKSEEGLEVLRWLTVSTKVVAGEAAGAIGEEVRRLEV